MNLLPEDVATAILKNEAAGTIDKNQAYDRATEVFLHRHICRANPWPADFQKNLDAWNWDVNNTMTGPYLTRVAGTFGTYDATPKLAQINVPTLLTHGEFDLALGGTMCSYHHMIAGSTLYRTKDGSHQPWFEFADDYNKRVAAFLAPIS